ncbi:bile acid:sodium symporter family protein [Paenibacillus sp. BSR1-1]|uniref:bile acid:sodium symporter family protein n=1 Tax=Paenibacillus sp. BSR1-1 TaxID=3020845 RepID=UPI0025AEDBF3|nr:bile acid:sodium symporter family protein [Paenibacillus sp. BSR1-1]MDN3017505.1 bile acid:sodium symporter family protein [Paenibacillus sp. BSR1-1]
MLQKLNKQLEKVMPFITPTGVVTGVLLSTYLKDYSFLIPWIFAFMTFAGSLSSNFKSLKEVITHPFPIFIAMLALHVLMPIWAWGVGHIAFRGDVYTITGLILGMIIPTGVTSFIWVSIYKGNIPLVLSIILIDTLLSPFLVPYSLSLFVGQKIDMDFISIMKGLFGMIVLPSLIGMFLNQMTKGKIQDQLGSKLAPFSKLMIGIVVMLNGAVVAPYLKHINLKLISIIFVVFFIALSGYLLSFLIGRLLKQDRDTVITLTFTGGMRNISAGAVIAVSFFPAAVAVPVVVGMLFQQILASLNGHFLDRFYQEKVDKQESVAL